MGVLRACSTGTAQRLLCPGEAKVARQHHGMGDGLTRKYFNALFAVQGSSCPGRTLMLKFFMLETNQKRWKRTAAVVMTTCGARRWIPTCWMSRAPSREYAELSSKRPPLLCTRAYTLAGPSPSLRLFRLCERAFFPLVEVSLTGSADAALLPMPWLVATGPRCRKIKVKLRLLK